MSWTTLPAVPLVWFATIRSFQDEGSARTLAVLGTALGLCWWGHSPIALWATSVAGVGQVLRIALQWPRSVALKSILIGCASFGAIAAYPIGSVIFFPPSHQVRAESFQHATAAVITEFLKNSFPAVVLPVSAIGRSLGDFQLGYGLWALLATSFFGSSLITVGGVRAFHSGKV